MVNKITILKALVPFLGKPKEKLHLAQISKSLNEPHPTVRQWLGYLEGKGVIKKTYQGRLTLFFLNFNHPNLIDYLVIAEKAMLIQRCEEWLALSELSSFLSKKLPKLSHILIFGSAIEAKSVPNDIDLLIVGKTHLAKLKDLSSKINKELHIVQLNRLEQISKALKVEIIKKHLLIKGSEDILRWMLW